MINYFFDNYEECRKEFLNKIDKTGEHKNYQLIDAHPDLITDQYYLASKKPSKKVYITVSGTHGSEGVTGSAIQRMMLDQIQEKNLNEKIHFYFIHLLNPYGVKFIRRTNINNIDLNRHFVTEDRKNLQNDGYRNIHRQVVIRPASTNYFLARMNALYNTLKTASFMGAKNFRNAAALGQYEFADGLFFGGKENGPEFKIIDGLVNEIKSKGFEQVSIIDLHTAYGKRGELHLLSPANSSLQKALYAGEDFGEIGTGGDFYQVNGSLMSYLEKQLSPLEVATCVFEFGTINTQKAWNGIDLFTRLSLETSVNNANITKEDLVKKVKRDLFEACNPSDKDWREMILKKAKTIQLSIINRLKDY